MPHQYRFPRPHAARLFVCAYHAQGQLAAEPLTEHDRYVIAERRARVDALLAPARARAARAAGNSGD